MSSSVDSSPEVPASSELEGSEEWMTTDQVAAEFGYNRETIRRWTREGRLKARRDAGGRKLWIRRSDFAHAAGRADINDRERTSESVSHIAGEPVTIAVPGDRTRLIAD